MIRPLRDYIAVRVESEHETPAGIVVPAATRMVDSRKQYGHRGTVVAVGPGKRTKRGALLPMELQPGDVVRFGEFPFQTADGLTLIQVADITCVECDGRQPAKAQAA